MKHAVSSNIGSKISSDVRQTKVHIAETLIPRTSFADVQTVFENI
jgi:hypothetical protein